MCGRFASILPPDLIAALFRISGQLPNYAPNWNVAPTQRPPVVRWNKQTGERRLDLLSWGLVPHFAKEPKGPRPAPINARAETVASNGMFRAALRDRRCIVPAAAFYEWKAEVGGKQPFAINRVDETPLAFAGIWESWKRDTDEILRTFAIITTTANATMQQVHERMPVILEAPDLPAWLGETEGDPVDLLRPAAEGVLRLWPAGRVRWATCETTRPICSIGCRTVRRLGRAGGA
jgi:putative SOS response-associated peptidase YedK